MSNTKFAVVYDTFLSKITDDMYMELTIDDTRAMLEELLMSALHWFEFPRENIFDYDKETREFNVTLSYEEINIIATYMIVEWIGQQLASVENTRMKYSGSDFKMTSQANHLQKLLALLSEAQRESFHMQRLYKRRKLDDNGVYQSNWSCLRDKSALK